MLHEKKLSSILADQMGLGKTIQTLAFIAYLLENGQNGTILIVCPVSTLGKGLVLIIIAIIIITYIYIVAGLENVCKSVSKHN